MSQQPAPIIRPQRPSRAGDDAWYIDTQGSPRTVQAWSSFRLPFEPKHERLRYRVALRETLAGVEAANGEIIHAEYCGPSTEERFDLENILFYNVGGSVFARVAIEGTIFEQRLTPPPSPPADATFSHYTAYEIVPSAAEFKYWTRSSDSQITVADISCRSLASSSAAEVWAAVHQALDEQPSREPGPSISGDFGIKVTIGSTRPANVCNFMKPLLDGLISACQRCDHVDDELARRVASQTGRPPDVIRRWLTRPDGVFLSNRCPVKPYRDGVMWHPEDHRCKAARILLNCRSGLTGSSLGFSLFPVQQK